MRGRAIWIAALAGVGCTFLAPRVDRSRYYTLTATVAEPAPTAGARSPGCDVGLGPIALPAYLDRAEVVTRVEPTRIVYSPTARWAAPLRTQVAAVLAQDLAPALGRPVRVFPWSGGAEPGCIVDVQVSAFERAPDGTVSLVATWQVRERGASPRGADGQAAISEAAATAADDEAVAAMSRALGTLAHRIAAMLRRANDAAGGAS